MESGKWKVRGGKLSIPLSTLHFPLLTIRRLLEFVGSSPKFVALSIRATTADRHVDSVDIFRPVSPVGVDPLRSIVLVGR